jgi:hypothetical protein
MPFICFSGFTVQTRTSSTMLNQKGESGHPCLVPIFRQKRNVKDIVSCRIFVDILSRSRQFLSLPVCLELMKEY